MPGWLWGMTVDRWIRLRTFEVRGVGALYIGLPDDDDVLDVTIHQTGRWGRQVRLLLDPDSLRFLATSLEELATERDEFEAVVAEGVRELEDL